MAKSALRRRRGTRRKYDGHAKLKTVLGGLLLIGVGLTVGLMVGYFFYSEDPVVQKEIENRRNQLKQLRGKPVGFGQPPGRPDLNLHPQAADHVSGAKYNFLDHKPQIGTSNKFPYYPAEKTVAENHDFSTFVPPGGNRFSEYKWGDSPYTHTEGESDDLARSRRYHVKKAMQHAWQNYEKYAFGADEIKPESLTSSSTWGKLGITLVDSLDTLWLMNMKEEFYRARDWCRDFLNHNQDTDVSVFETTIRSLGGLLSAYDWSQDEVFLNQAKDLGARLIKSYDSESGIPFGRVNLKTGKTSNLAWSPMDAILAEFGTQQVEFRVLTKLSGLPEYKVKSERVFQIMRDMKPNNALYPYFISNHADKANFSNDKLTFGAMADSFYEYMLKIWLQGGKTEQLYRDMYDESMQGMFDELLSVSSPSNLVFIADKDMGRMDTKQDHLVCFMGGLLALGAYTDPLGLESERAQRDLKTAKVRWDYFKCPVQYNDTPSNSQVLKISGLDIHLLSNLCSNEEWYFSRIYSILSK
jgi:mannosyl-oligosaccharide alpha-1,2-mannosidase